jgi:hypothetical protein
MAAPTTEDRLRAVHDRAVERFDRAYCAQRDIRQQCAQDRRFVFVPGAQYDGDIGEQFANRARFEINKMHQAVLRTFSEYRNNRVSVDFRPADEDTSDETADFLDSLYRADEQESGGQEAYDTAFEEGVAGGMGAWRLINAYEDEEDEDDDRQRIRMVPIPDADQSVFFDADAKRYDKADAMCAWVITPLADDSYEAETGEEGGAPMERSVYTERKTSRDKGAGVASFDKVSRTGVFDWFQPDVIYVAEYYEVEMAKDTLTVFEQEASSEEVKVKRSQFADKADYDAKLKELQDQGFAVKRTKKIKTRRVHKYLIDGNRVIEDCGYIAGKHIPVVPYYAKRQIVDGIERVSGRVRLAIDAQRLYNMLASALAEIAADSPKEKPIFTPQQIAGHEEMWSRDNIDRYPYLLVNPLTDAAGQMIPTGPIAYTKPPQIPPALAGLIQLVGADLQELLGTNGDQQEVVSNISAKAVELIQNRLDMADFVFMDNLKQSMRRAGEIWLSMARDLYDEDERPMRVVKADGSDEVRKLRVPGTGKDGAAIYLNDPNAGKFKAVADVGPSFTTRRDGTVRAITGMLQFVEDLQDKAVLTGVAIQNLEGEGLQDVKDYWRRKMVAMGVTQPTEDEQAELQAAQQNQKPDPQSEFLMAEAEKSRAAAAKMLQEIETLASKAKEHEASAAEKLAKIEALDLQTIMQMVDSLTAQTQSAGQPAPVAAAPVADPAAQPEPVA